MKKILTSFITLSTITVSTMCWSDDNFDLLLAPDVISQRISEVAAQIDSDYEGEELAVVLIMKGAFVVAADLVRQLHIPCTIEYVKASSYGKNGMKGGELYIDGIERLNLIGKNVLLVDDIFDTGKTMSTLVQKFQVLQPKSLKTLVLLVKDVTRTISYLPDYTMFNIKNRFVIGYGLDYKEYYRGLSGIYAFVNDTPPEDLTILPEGI